MADRSDRADRAVLEVSASAWATLLLMLWHGPAYPALPPSLKEATSVRGVDASAKNGSARASEASTDPAEDSPGMQWVLPRVRFGGTLSYNAGQNSFESQKSAYTGQMLTLTATTNTYIWRPWFAQINGSLGVSKSTNSSSTRSENEFLSGSNRSAFVTGAAQLSILAQSSFPFSGHFSSNDSRATADLSTPTGYRSQTYGFTQNFFNALGRPMVAWERTNQMGAENGRDTRDALQLTMSHSLGTHALSFSAMHNSTRREQTGEQTGQDNVTLQHSFVPDEEISVASMASASRFGAELQNGSSNTHLLQLNSQVFWRPEEEYYSLNGGVRAFVIESQNRALSRQNGAVGLSAFELRTLNANAGLNYEFNPETRLYGSLNVNLTENSAGNTIVTSQSVGASYQPVQIALGAFQYGWGTSANVNNQTGSENGGAQLNLQFSHSLSRSTSLESGATLGVSLSQGLSTVNTLSVGDGKTPLPNTQSIVHNASLTWSAAHEGGSAMVQASASDSRSLDGRPEFFQLINLQASSSMAVNDTSSWSGGVTLQASRQNALLGNVGTGLTNASGNGFNITSGGSLSYQNQRFFKVRRLRFVSDLQLNSQALLPLLDNGLGQEMSAWNNRLSYAIGRTQLQVGLQVSNSSTPIMSIDPVTKVETVQRIARRNQSIMFTVSRNFGDL